jgi:hypothetical protein
MEVIVCMMYKLARIMTTLLISVTTTTTTTTKCKVLSVTGRGGLQGCEMLRIPHCLDNWLTDGGNVVSPMHRPHFTPQKYYFSACGNHFC